MIIAVIFQFKHLEGRSLKNIRAPTGFKPLTSATPVTAMITLNFHLQSQYKNEFHIHFISLHCTGRYELKKLTSLPMCGFTAHLVKHRTGIAEVPSSNHVEALIFQVSSFQLLKLEIYCDAHSSLSCKNLRQ